ncbi:unnamed protein product [Fusarium graminearum]|nr:unnamed protein product [Fusarium graminearum]CAG1990993.1 unnamed protein product [Fusarium graminearum]
MLSWGINEPGLEHLKFEDALCEMEFAAPWSTTVAVEATYMIQRLMSPCCIISTRAAHLAM